MNCKYCGKPVGLLRKLAGQSFCSDGHQKKFKDEHEALALSRLEESWSKTQQIRVPVLELPAESLSTPPAAATLPAVPADKALPDKAPAIPAPVASPAPPVSVPPAGPESTKPFGFLPDMSLNPRMFATARTAGGGGITTPEAGRPGFPRLVEGLAGELPVGASGDPPLGESIELAPGDPRGAAIVASAALTRLEGSHGSGVRPDLPAVPRADVSQALLLAEAVKPAPLEPAASSQERSFEATTTDLTAPAPVLGRTGVLPPPGTATELATSGALDVPPALETAPVEIFAAGVCESGDHLALPSRAIEGWADWNSPAGLHAWMEDFVATWFPEDRAGRVRPKVAPPADPAPAGKLRLVTCSPRPYQVPVCAGEVTALGFTPAILRSTAAHRHQLAPRALRSRTAPVPLSLRVPELAAQPHLEPERLTLTGAGAA